MGVRHVGKLRLVSAALIALGLFALMRELPADRLLEGLRSHIDGYGAFGPIAYGALFVLGILAFFPGTALTLAAGALFGFPVGLCVTSLAATLGATLAFLLSRYLLRARVERALSTHPRFAAIDAAVAAEGARVVALLRLSPLIPFGLANYAYGMTAVRLGPYVFATWAAILPGAALYVYLGDLGGAAIRGQGPSPAQWALFGVGLFATACATWTVARIARARLGAPPAPPAPGMPNGPRPSTARANTWLLLSGALSIWAAVVFARMRPEVLAGLFGPPAVVAVEAYPLGGSGVTFDHGAWKAVLSEFVDDAGRVDYEGLSEDPADLNRYLASLAQADLGPLGRDERLALSLNAYNAFTLRLVLDHLPLDSIRAIPAGERWRGRTWELGGERMTLHQLEHEECRGRFIEPRVHFALNCASVSCPPLALEAFGGATLEAQLEACARRVHEDPRWFAYDAARGTLHLTRLYQWYGADFAQVAGSPQAFAARYDQELARALATGATLRVEWLDYDWGLNAQR